MKKDKQYWIKKFEAFLKENNCYEEFKFNMKNYSINRFEKMYHLYKDTDISIFDRIVSCAFIFYRTNREHFWYELDEKWSEVCKNDL